ncbi:MAG: DNA translocase FtsK 4TM domain-containing protein, partial [Acidobacteria bacterium]|nr:DNA translocase FtsK 4TM domain-containing protein [Acidobacteriota bacterium]
MNATSTLSRRISEFIGVVFFALALLWLIALATHNPDDPAWFFNSATTQPATNLAGRVGAFLSELSFQLVGYAAYLFPVIAAVLGWCRFWCRPIDAPYTKLVGVSLLFASLASLVGLALAPARMTGMSFEPGGWLGDQLAGALSASFNRTGSIIIILTCLFLSLILTTQFSFGRMFALIAASIKAWVTRRTEAFRTW